MSNEGVKQTETVAQGVDCKIVVSSLAIRHRGPMPGEPLQLLLDLLLFNQVPAALDQFHRDDTRQPNRWRQGCQPGHGGWIAAKEIDHYISVQKHRSSLADVQPGPATAR